MTDGTAVYASFAPSGLMLNNMFVNSANVAYDVLYYVLNTATKDYLDTKLGVMSSQISSLGKSGSYFDIADYPAIYTTADVNSLLQPLIAQVDNLKALTAKLGCTANISAPTNYNG